VKSYLPAAACLIGLLSCVWLLARRPSTRGAARVEIVVYGPDGKIIPAIHRVDFGKR